MGNIALPDVATINLWFDGFHIAVYLAVIFITMIVYYQWKWAKVCKENIQLLIAQQGGGGSFQIVPKEGNIATFKQGDTIRTWAINELATIDVLYPGVGFVPAFLQKTIRMAIVNEGDWEPMLNRSPHRENIASPDVVNFLAGLAHDNPNLANRINMVIGKLATGPSRELVADPAMLGSLRSSTVMRALATVSNDLMDTLKSINLRLSKIGGITPMSFYLGIGILALVIGGVGFIVYQQQHDLDLIKTALGIVEEVTTKTK
jgi:hypothetical protein